MKKNLYTVKIDCGSEAEELYRLLPELKVSYFCNGQDVGEISFKEIHPLDFDYFDEEYTYILITEKHSNIINEYKRKQSLLKEEFIKEMNESL